MPPVVGLAVGGGITLFGSSVLGSLAISTVLAGGSYLLQSALAPKLGGGGGGQQQGQDVISRQAVPVQRLIVGRAQVAGPLFFLEVKPPYLYYGIVLASHEIDGVERTLVDERLVTFDGNGDASSTPFKDGANVYLEQSVRLGTAAQTIDTILTADFTELPSTFRQRGHATVVAKMDYGGADAAHRTLWGSSDPRLRFLVKGAKVFDPRDPSQSSSDETTWQWSETPSLIQAFYLNHAKGFKVPWSQIDLVTLAQAANDDDQRVGRADGTYEPRYTCNGVINLDSEPASVLQDLLTSNLGRVAWSDGKYRFFSGVPRTPVWTLNDDSARGAMELTYSQSRANLINTVRTRFTAPDRDYQLADGPVISNSSYVTDDGTEHAIAIDLPFTNSPTMAQRLANATMELSRRGKRVARGEDFNSLRLSASDIVTIESDIFRNMGTTYEIESVQLNDDDTFQVTAQEYDTAVFDWVPATDEQAFAIAPAELEGTQ